MRGAQGAKLCGRPFSQRFEKFFDTPTKFQGRISIKDLAHRRLGGVTQLAEFPAGLVAHGKRLAVEFG